MSGRLMDLEDRLGQWARAFDVVRREITPDDMRNTLAAMREVEGVEGLASYMSLARNVMANDRSALVVAAMLVTSGIRPVFVDANSGTE
jgi:hypothetical protein